MKASIHFPALGNARGRIPRRPAASFARQTPITVQRAPGCACGGGCPRCQKGTYAKRRVGDINDRYEREAERRAEQVTSAPTPAAAQAVAAGVTPVVQTQGLAPPTAETAISRPHGGEPLPAATRAFMELRFGADFGSVRVHTGDDAKRMNADLRAHAFTYGADIWLGENESVHDRKLMAHELTHILQQRAGAVGVQRTPFKGETAELETRRLAAIKATRATIVNIEKGLRAGYLWPLETMVGSKIESVYGKPETVEERKTRLTTLIDDLWQMVTELESGPIPKDWLDPLIKFPGVGTDESDNDVHTFYGHRMQASGMDADTVFNNWTYMEADPVPTRKVKTVPEDYGIGLGEWLVIKDPVNRPQEWVRLSGFDPIDGEIVELRSDHRGYYYYWQVRKTYLPNYPDH